MTVLINKASMDDYLKPSVYIDFQHESIQLFVQNLSLHQQSEIEKTRLLFEFVRDRIDHSWDIQSSRITKKASEVLEYREGICYAKSHLLAALLRAHGIPSGICYQRLTLFDKPEDGYVIHALNTAYLQPLNRWIRLDARGNKPGVDSQFSLNEEYLAFPIRETFGEIDYKVNYAEPHSMITETLESNSNCIEMYLNRLPSDLS